MFKKLAVMAAMVMALVCAMPIAAFADDEGDVTTLDTGAATTTTEGAATSEVVLGYYKIYDGVSSYSTGKNTLEDGHYYSFSDGYCDRKGESLDAISDPASYIKYSEEGGEHIIYVAGNVTVKGYVDSSDTSVVIAALKTTENITIKSLNDKKAVLTLESVTGANALDIADGKKITFDGNVNVFIKDKTDNVPVGKLDLTDDFDGIVILIDESATDGITKILKETTSGDYSFETITDVTTAGLGYGESLLLYDEKTYLAGNGTITYTKTGSDDTATYKLTLNGATIARPTSGGNAIDLETISFEIELIGENKIEATGGDAIKVNGTGYPLTISGSGSLEISAKNGINAGSNSLTVEDAKLDIYATDTAITCGSFKAEYNGIGDEADIKLRVKNGGIVADGDIEIDGGYIDIEQAGGTTGAALVAKDSSALHDISIDGAKVEVTWSNDSDYAVEAKKITVSGDSNASWNVNGKGILAKEGITATNDSFKLYHSFVEVGATATVSGINAVVKRSDGDSGYTYEAHGECELTQALGSSVSPVELTVENGAIFTIEEIYSLYANKLTVNGKLINNGQIYLADGYTYSKGTNGEFVNNGVVHLTGNQNDVEDLGIAGGYGYVEVTESGSSSTTNYNNNGAEVKTVETGIDLTGSSFSASVEDYGTKGYWYDETNKTLYLKDVIVKYSGSSGPDPSIKLPNDDITIVCEGDVTVTGTIDGCNITGKTITIKGNNSTGDVYINKINPGYQNLTIEDITLGVESIQNGNNFSVLVVKNSKVTAHDIMFEYNVSASETSVAKDEDGYLKLNDYGYPYYDSDDDKNSVRWGVELYDNSTLTVEGESKSSNAGLMTSRITLDDNSKIILKNARLNMYGHTINQSTFEKEIEKYVPNRSGYKFGIPATSGSETDRELQHNGGENDGKTVYTITLRKQSGSTEIIPGGDGDDEYTPGGDSSNSTVTYKINVEESENGLVESNRKYTSAGTTVTLTVTEDDGFSLGSIAIVDSKGNPIEVRDKGNGVFKFEMPRDDVWVFSEFEEDEPYKNPFKDVNEDDWFKDAVDYVHKNGLMSGITSDTFGGDVLVSRAMLVTILWRMEGCPESSFETTFTDLNEYEYYYEAVLWAAEKGIVSGVSETIFAPASSVTREQFAAILYRYANLKGYDTTQGGMAVREYLDYEEISDYAKPNVAWAVNIGMLQGRGNGKIEPTGGATRAEVASMIMRFKTFYR